MVVNMVKVQPCGHSCHGQLSSLRVMNTDLMHYTFQYICTSVLVQHSILGCLSAFILDVRVKDAFLLISRFIFQIMGIVNSNQKSFML